MSGTKKLSKLAKDTDERSGNVNNVKVAESDKLCRSRSQLDIHGVSLGADTSVASSLALELWASQTIFRLFHRYPKNTGMQNSPNSIDNEVKTYCSYYITPSKPTN